MSRLLEITVESLDAALAAERGGAGRIELCAELSVGGVTPSAETMRKLRRELRIPVFAIIRPRSGNFVYSEPEFAAMKLEVARAREIGLGGLVLGILRLDDSVDVPRTRELVELARPLKVTFHRAFDESRALFQSLEEVIASGATRILTSGGAAGAPEGISALRQLVEAAAGRIIIMPGAGLTAANIGTVAENTGACEFHSGLSRILPYGSKNLQRFEEEVRAMKSQLALRR